MTRRPCLGDFLAILTVSTLGCGAVAKWNGQKPMRVEGVDQCQYEVEVASERPLLLEVSVSCKGPGVRGLETDDPRVADAIEVPRDREGPLRRQGPSFYLKHSRPQATFRYRVNLERLAEREDFDLALRSGRSLMAPVSSFLLYPLPLDVGIEVELRVKARAGFDFITGLTRSASGYRLQGHEIPVATYAAFGAKIQQELWLDSGRGVIDLAVLDGKLAVETDVLAAWIQPRAKAVADFYGRPPARRTLVVIVPVPGHDDVMFGKLLPESAPGVLLLLGSDAKESDLFSDWVLVHELFHIGVPSFYEEGKWFDEGLATYYEPILRARAGLLDEKTLWSEFAREMPRGLSALTEDGLEHTRDYTGLYWGGAIYCLIADVQARQQSRGRLGLEHGLRRVFRAGGRAWEVWELARVLATADAAYPAPILEPLRVRYAEAPAPLELEATFDALGIVRHGADISLRDDAPLAWLRRAIVHGPR